MRLYAVADIHGRTDHMAAIKKNLKTHCPDVLITAGDITNYFRVSAVVSELADLGLPVLAVRGNTDFKRVACLLARKPDMFFLGNRDMMLQGIHFAGVSGTLPVPFRTRIAFRETDIWHELVPVITPETVLVAHPPPFGYQDRVGGKFHAGCRSLEKVVRDRQPALVICGHIHEDAGISRLGNTLVVNCAMGSAGQGAVIDIENGRVSAQILGTRS
jgi:Icc-related predicted phosphoesterase